MRVTVPEPSGHAVPRRVGASPPFEEWVVGGIFGDDVPVRVARPPGEVRGVLVVGHGLHGSRSSPYITGASRKWSAGGIAVVSFDFPLSGDRADPTRPPDAIRDPAVVHQSVGDIDRVAAFAVGAFGAVPVVYLGFSNGAILGTIWAAQSDGADGLCLVVAGSRARSVRHANPGLPDEALALIEAVDPATYAAGFSPRPVLMLCADRDEQFDRLAAFDLYDAFGAPKELVFFPGTHTEWPHPGPVYRRITAFVEQVVEDAGPGRRFPPSEGPLGGGDVDGRHDGPQ